MSEPDEIRFACIGCGALNAAGSEVCSGCGHRFAGPEGVLNFDGRPEEVSAYLGPQPAYRGLKPIREPSVLGCFGRAFVISLGVILTPVAFVVAFFLSCANSPWSEPLTRPTIAGLCAAGLVIIATVAFVYGIGLLSRANQGQDPPGRKEDR